MYILYFVFSFKHTTGPSCTTLEWDLECNTCTEDVVGTGTVTPTNVGMDCGASASGTCDDGVCIGGK